jgi:tight adherence protein C
MTLAVFLLVAFTTAFVGLRLGDFRARALGRLVPVSTKVAPFLPAPAMIWHELVDRIGTVVPVPSRDLPRLRRLLVRAGFRNPDAARNFYGVRLLSTVLLGSAALFFSLRSSAATDRTLIMVGVACYLGFTLPTRFLQARIRRRQHAIERALPNALDLLVVCVESGLGLDQAILQVAKELQNAHPAICEEFAVMNLELRAGKRRVEALHNLAERAGVPELKKLVAVMIQTDRFGTSIAQALRGHADYIRTMARQSAEERAAKLAVKLVFPIFFCVLPSLFVVTVGPVLTRLVRDLLPMIENM